jgi:hypothetical protein
MTRGVRPFYEPRIRDRTVGFRERGCSCRPHEVMTRVSKLKLAKACKAKFKNDLEAFGKQVEAFKIWRLADDVLTSS